MSKPDTSAITLSLLLAKAQALAGNGHFDEAEALLAPMGKLPEDPVALETLACLMTKAGDHQRALRLWRILQQRVPGHREAARLIPSLELWLERPSWFAYLPAGGAVLAGFAVIGILVWAFSSPSPTPMQASTPSSVVARPVAQTTYQNTAPAYTPPPVARPAADEPKLNFSLPAAKPAKPVKSGKRP